MVHFGAYFRNRFRKWLVMCVLVRLKGWDRPWALPILCGMCVSPKLAGKIGARQKTPSQIARQLLTRLMRWFPNRKFILTGDYQVITHETVGFAQRHADRVTVIGHLRGDANLYAPPKHPGRRCRAGSRSKKGRKLPVPAQRIGQLKPVLEEVNWYGGSRRKVRHVSEQALWYDKHGRAVTRFCCTAVHGRACPTRSTSLFFVIRSSRFSS